ncbi:DUF2784 domain-containing protein [Marinobacter sp. BGYM27]|uniref:DUF2784 domain-containing protein n=1 Tax=Marinobacter sp. BGYM27 TaxID=2975597 RepID=UPI0021A2E65B|nr:DUF2784 domain-containing protein [Marinobacter sp. BGYM27]MDG5501191.1 DUF2784 domain-containing protein [Marinobacter sp. BGYM27]
MLWRLAADALLLFHLLFILFAVAGGLLALRYRKLVWLHLPAVIWASLVMFNGWICPLTPLEVSLRQQAGDVGYSGSFIAHYLLPLIYPPGLTRGVQILLGGTVAALNIGIYSWLWAHRKHR